MKRLLIAAPLIAALCACSNQDAAPKADDPEPSVTITVPESSPPEGPDIPACDDVWKLGATLPADYDGCTWPDGAIESPVVYDCDSGIGKFTGYDDRFFALIGGKIGDATDQDAYGKAYAECFADS